MYTGFKYDILSYISTNKSDILKTEGKLKIMRDGIVYIIMSLHIRTNRNFNSVQ